MKQRMQRINKQRMFYSLPNGQKPKYEIDDDGNIKTIVVDGVEIPIDTGEFETAYTFPKEFKASIFSQLKDGIMRAYGKDNSNNYAVLVVEKVLKDNEGNAIKLVNGTRIWRDSNIKYKKDGSVDETSANYVVNGVMTEELNENSYYLQCLDGGIDE